jgi:hypothetical protein
VARFSLRGRVRRAVHYGHLATGAYSRRSSSASARGRLARLRSRKSHARPGNACQFCQGTGECCALGMEGEILVCSQNLAALIPLGSTPSAGARSDLETSQTVHSTSTGSSSPHRGRHRRCRDCGRPRPVRYGRPAPPTEGFHFRVQPRSRNSSRASPTERVPNPSTGPFPIGVFPIRRPLRRFPRLTCVHQNRRPHRLELRINEPQFANSRHPPVRHSRRCA